MFKLSKIDLLLHAEECRFHIRQKEVILSNLRDREARAQLSAEIMALRETEHAYRRQAGRRFSP